MLALSVRQPFAEMILRGVKTIEYRSRATTRIGERFWLYASKKPAESAEGEGKSPPPWMIELANGLRLFPEVGGLPTGVIVGSAVIDRVARRDDGMWQWHLAAWSGRAD